MNGGNYRDSHFLNPEQPITQALVIVYNIESIMAQKLFQLVIGSDGEGKRFRERSRE